MNRIILFLAFLAIAACSNGSVEEPSNEVALESTAPELTFEPGESSGVTVKPQGPVSIAYRIIGTAIVDQPLGIDLQITSMDGPQQITMSYRVNDSTAMQFGESQPASVTIAAAGADTPSLQQVRVIPLREGRVFLNVSASVETDNGTRSTVIAIPVQVSGVARPGEDDGT